MKARLTLFAVIVGLQCGTIAGRAGTSDVYKLVADLSGYIQGGGDSVINLDTGSATVSNANVIESVLINSASLINLALGTALTDPIPKNVVLAFTSDCATNQSFVIVYDTVSGAKLTTIGALLPVFDVEGYQKKNNRNFGKQEIADLVIFPTGSVTNALTGGLLSVDASLTTETNGCIKAVKANVQGTLGTSFFTVFTNYFCTNVISCNGQNTNKCSTNCVVIATNITAGISNITVVISKSKFSSGGKKLGTLIEP
ncbi:MAG: hypothetical protein WCS70_12145 [Verrucomicrobiota bacterium]